MKSPLAKSLTIEPIDRVPGWDSFVESHPHGSIFHTAAMVAALRRTPHYKPLAIAALRESGEIAGLMVANNISLPGLWPSKLTARSIFFAEPIVTEGELGQAALKRLLHAHDREMRNHVVFAEVRPMFAASPNCEIYAQAGYEYMDYNNYELDLNQSPGAVFAAMSRMRRHNIRANERRGLTVREANAAEEVQIFYRHLMHSFERSQVPLVDLLHFTETFSRLPESQYRLTFAELDGRPIASACHLMFKDRMFWWHAGTERIPGIAAQSSLVWEAIQWGINHNQKLYDFAGAGWNDEEYGPGIFKSRFGGTHVNLGRYRKVYSKLRMKIAEAGYRIGRPLLPSPNIRTNLDTVAASSDGACD